MKILKSILLDEINWASPGVDAYVGIEYSGSLEGLVQIVSKALGLTFSGTSRFEEYPAYEVFLDGLVLSLLGPPDPEFDIRDESDSHYQLQLMVTNVSDTDPATIDVSETLANELQKLVSLKCWPL